METLKSSWIFSDAIGTSHERISLSTTELKFALKNMSSIQAELEQKKAPAAERSVVKEWQPFS